MNRIRIIGLFMLIIGIILRFIFENDGADFLMGLLIGGGFALLLTGRIGNKVKEQKKFKSSENEG